MLLTMESIKKKTYNVGLLLLWLWYQSVVYHTTKGDGWWWATVDYVVDLLDPFCLRPTVARRLESRTNQSCHMSPVCEVGVGYPKKKGKFSSVCLSGGWLAAESVCLFPRLSTNRSSELSGCLSVARFFFSRRAKASRTMTTLAVANNNIAPLYQR